MNLTGGNMPNLIKTIPIIFILIAYALISAQPFEDIYRKHFSFENRIGNIVKQKSKGLSKSLSQDWRCIGRTHYQNVNSSTDSAKWTFSQRDTLIYDELGNFVQYKSSKAQNGWTKDSLIWTDSCIYDEQNLLQTILFTSYGDSGKASWGRDNCSYALGGKACVSTRYTMNNSEDGWIPITKDSIVFSIPETEYIESEDYEHFVGYFYYEFDNQKSTWNCSEYYTRIDSECIENMLVERGRYWLDTNWLDIKRVYKFKSNVWQYSNIVEDEYQSTNSSKGEYYLQKCLYFKDSYGNDTLLINFIYDTSQSIWDTNSSYRYKFTYDSYGNEIVSIESFCYASLEPSRAEEKIISTFALIKPTSTRAKGTVSSPNISIKRVSNSIQFSASGLSAVNLYNLSGRLIAQVRQRSGPTASFLLLSLPFNKITPGLYIAEVMVNNIVNAYTIAISK